MFKNSFWGILKKGDWNNENEDQVFEPILQFLIDHNDKYIFDFHDLMSEFLYQLDRKEILEHSIHQDQVSDEDFLNQRAYVLTNGNKYYHDIISLIKPMDGELKCPKLLTLPAKAWSLKIRNLLKNIHIHLNIIFKQKAIPNIGKKRGFLKSSF